MFGICDGHGLNGHIVSQFIKDQLPLQFLSQTTNNRIDLESTKLSKIENLHKKMPKMMNNAFNNIHDMLKNPSGYETSLSGSTCVTTVFDRNVVFCSNAGDSRSVLYSYNKRKNGLKVQPMSIDHKPCMSIEKNRIESSGGRVDAIKGLGGQNLGPMRVWLKD